MRSASCSSWATRALSVISSQSRLGSMALASSAATTCVARPVSSSWRGETLTHTWSGARLRSCASQRDSCSQVVSSICAPRLASRPDDSAASTNSAGLSSSSSRSRTRSNASAPMSSPVSMATTGW